MQPQVVELPERDTPVKGGYGGGGGFGGGGGGGGGGGWGGCADKELEEVPPALSVWLSVCLCARTTSERTPGGR